MILFYSRESQKNMYESCYIHIYDNFEFNVPLKLFAFVLAG